MKAHFTGFRDGLRDDFGDDVAQAAPMGGSKTEPIEVDNRDGRDLGPTHAEIAQIGDQLEQPGKRGQPVILAGRYRLLRRLGSGGMGTVYMAERVGAERVGPERVGPERVGAVSETCVADRCFDPPIATPRLAIKILDASAREWCRSIDRFLWEARLCARIRHPNVVTAYEYGSTPSGVVYMAMELLEGHDLRAMLRERGARAQLGGVGHLSWRWTRSLMRQICHGVDALHRVGVVHRDLKASNCFYVRRNSSIKIIDLGIAAFEDPLLMAPGSEDRTIVGTPEYMAPEQVRGAPVDRRADVYSAGILLYELLSGRVPFAGPSTEAVFEQQLREPAPPLDAWVQRWAPDVVIPSGLDAVVRKALAKRPRDRYHDMRELAGALEELPPE